MSEHEEVTVSASSDLTPDQVRLVKDKVGALRKARDLQVQLAAARSDLTRIDEEMLKANFHIPALACW